ncbi:MAG: tRNA 2-thiocytidine(32) synthetase TtcA, partial [Deltaproteobacteria bacterium]|nr:tRNA 2-thiocytidine(32) synthetase TtcA [Deltaproteobacteria bacterium]
MKPTEQQENCPAKRKKKRTYPSSIQKVFRHVGRAADEFRMFEEGDRIMVGVSGTDSLCLLWVLRERLNWIPIRYDLKAVFVDPGFDERMGAIIKHYLQNQGYDYEIIKTDIGLRAHSPENRENTCFYCSWQRKKKLFAWARENRCNKIALGHHLEDINTTLLINIIYGGSISTMMPRQDLFGGNLSIIRPLALLYKDQITRLANDVGLPILVNPCPSSATSQRKEIGDILNRFYQKDPRIRYTIFRSLQHVRNDYIP